MRSNLVALLVLFSALAVGGTLRASNELTDENRDRVTKQEERWECHTYNDRNQWFAGRGIYRHNAKQRSMDHCAEVSYNCHFWGCFEN
jgi:hypothetical protein